LFWFLEAWNFLQQNNLNLCGSLIHTGNVNTFIRGCTGYPGG
jgi:hypothetical protein